MLYNTQKAVVLALTHCMFVYICHISRLCNNWWWYSSSSWLCQQVGERGQ